jgi:predicted nucleotidyltransferase
MRLARRLAAEGAAGVVLCGSVARGTAHALSDIDLYALGEGPGYRLERVAETGELVSISWRTPEAVRASFADPPHCAAAVSGWRDAVVLHDPEGVAAVLQAEARAWTWDAVASACDAYAAEALTGLAEEAQKLRAAIARGDAWDAAVQHNVIAMHAPLIVAVHLHIMPATEFETWPLVAARMGDDWRAAEDAAFTQATDWRAAADAALTLLRLATDALQPILDERQRGVLAGA